MNENENTSPAPFVAHMFGGIDDRCFGCDVRPWSRHAEESCPNY